MLTPHRRHHQQKQQQQHELLVFLFCNKNLMNFLQINFTNDFIRTMSTHPEASEDAVWGGRAVSIPNFQRRTHFQTQ